MIEVEENKIQLEGAGNVLVAECVGAIVAVSEKIAIAGGHEAEEIVDTIFKGVQAHRLLKSGMDLKTVREILK